MKEKSQCRPSSYIVKKSNIDQPLYISIEKDGNEMYFHILSLINRCFQIISIPDNS